MQIIFKNKDKENNSRRLNSVDIIICIERVSRCIEGKHIRRFKISGSRV